MATWPNSNATQGKITKHCSGYKVSVGSLCHASNLQATDRETDPSSHRRRRTPHHHHRNLHHNLTKLTARDKAVSIFWNCTRKPPKRNTLHAIGCSKVKGFKASCSILNLVSRVDIACHMTSLYHSFSCRYSMSYDISIFLLKKNFCKKTISVKALGKGKLIYFPRVSMVNQTWPPPFLGSTLRVLRQAPFSISFQKHFYKTKSWHWVRQKTSSTVHDRGLGYSNRFTLCRGCTLYPHHPINPLGYHHGPSYTSMRGLDNRSEPSIYPPKYACLPYGVNLNSKPWPSTSVERSSSATAGEPKCLPAG
jgi:hypothetical protein